jgi:hypothetical protein
MSAGRREGRTTSLRGGGRALTPTAISPLQASQQSLWWRGATFSRRHSKERRVPKVLASHPPGSRTKAFPKPGALSSLSVCCRTEQPGIVAHYGLVLVHRRQSTLLIADRSPVRVRDSRIPPSPGRCTTGCLHARPGLLCIPDSTTDQGAPRRQCAGAGMTRGTEKSRPTTVRA